MSIFDDSKGVKYVDVILPLALPKLLTYFIPPEIEDQVQVGARVVVQLQKDKLYTGVISKIHQDKPVTYSVKPVLSLLDDAPIVHESHIKFWEWMSSYYMCTLGETMTAALPSGLKLNSEAKIVSSERDDLDQDVLTDREYIIVEALEVRPYLTIADVQNMLQIKTVQPIVKKLVDKGFAIVEQELKYKYKPKMEAYIELSEFADDEDNLKELFDQLVRAPKQLEALMVFVHQSSRYTNKVREVKRADLLKDERVSAAAIRELIKKEIFVEKKLQVGRFNLGEAAIKDHKELSGDQKAALGQINAHFLEKDVVLLHGVTSSGKTELYVKLIEEAIQRGEQVLFLLPEIALTTQLIQRINEYFPGLVGVYHSKFNENERVEVWNNVLQFDPEKGLQPFQIIMGARSSLFLPYNHLGLIIVDEEHDPSYKQNDPAPRYHARDSAIYLASRHGAKVVLGSATPSVESNHNAQKEKFGLVKMLKRYGNVKLPNISTINLKRAYEGSQMRGHFSTELIDMIGEALEKREQVILFQNRRGFSLVLSCETCGYVPQCRNCDITLTYHKATDILRCHYCGFQTPMMTKCKKCDSTALSTRGFGTEKIEEEVSKLFPKANVSRLDFDTTRKKHSYYEILQNFADGSVDILVGTQMITKGLDFDNVSMVGILNADNMLHYPDFRATERAFQLMLQVSGRAGRREKQGRVVIQTYDPDNKVIQRVLAHDYEGMYADEVAERQVYKYPPFHRLVEISVRNRDYKECKFVAKELAFKLREKMKDRVLGPEYPSIGRLKNYFIFNILIKNERDVSPTSFKEFLESQIFELQQTKEGKRTLFHIDVDPY